MAAEPGIVVETADGRFCGAVIGLGQAVDAGERRATVVLEDRHGRRRDFPLLPAAFSCDGRLVTLVPRTPARGALDPGPGPNRLGIVAVPGRARAGGREPDLGRRPPRRGAGRTHLGRRPASRRHRRRTDRAAWTTSPGSRRLRAGRGTDGWAYWSTTWYRAARKPGSSPRFAGLRAPYVLVTGHPYVDIWQAVKPTAIGIDQWPVVPRGQPWKQGICAALGVSAPAELWRRVLASVDSYADVEVPLLRAVEQLLDFVTD